MNPKPRILLLADQRGWAYDRAAQGLSQALSSAFDFTIRYVADQPNLDDEDFDLLHVFYWGETWHRDQVTDPGRVVKEISSHRFQQSSHGSLTPREMADTWLMDAAVWGCTSRRLQGLFAGLGETHWIPNGFDPRTFHPEGRCESESLRIGWAGNAADACKGLQDILLPAAGTDFELLIADGSLDPSDMGAFYRSLDLLCVASTAEGEPLTLVEAMACGCTPLAVDVGIVPELLASGDAGWILPRDPAAFRAAFQWCERNAGQVAKCGARNAQNMARTRTWEHVAGHWHRFWVAALERRQTQGSLALSRPAHETENHERNLGEDLGTWPDRARIASRLLEELPLVHGATVLDLGCGTQPLRPALRKDLVYLPVDRLQRSSDTLVWDLDDGLPPGRSECALVLGVLEYLQDTHAFLDDLARRTSHVILSCNDGSNVDKRNRQHWQLEWSLDQLEQECLSRGFSLRQRVELSPSERVYLWDTPDAGGYPVPRVEGVRAAAQSTATEPAIRRLALFSASVHGDNSGDALIEDAIRRLLPDYETELLPLHYSPSEEEIERANSCDLGVLCGTNLYQDRFACGLTDRVLDRLDLPLLPLGVGGSAPLGQAIRMQSADTRRVRRIHERAHLASVRDPRTLEFLEGLGIDNVKLTACPVLFHALDEPCFEGTPTGPLHVSVRSRLLHIEESYGDRQLSTLLRLADRYHPRLILQSPYDFALAHGLARRFDLELRFDPSFQVGPLVSAARESAATLGFRLHYGMLSLSYGKPARFLGTDTRTESFCQMMGLPHEDLRHYDESRCVETALDALEDPEAFCMRWRELALSMIDVLETNGLSTTLQVTDQRRGPARGRIAQEVAV